MCVPMMTHLVLWFLVRKAANPQLVLTEVSAGDLTGFVQSQELHATALPEAPSNASQAVRSSDPSCHVPAGPVPARGR